MALFLLLMIPTTYATCYFPNGNADTNYRQCPNSLSCCLEGEACLSNGLCFTGNFGILYRGACADKSWNTPDCPRACFDEISYGWANLFQCSDTSSTLTCSHQDSSAGSACQDGHGLGKFEYTSGNVTAAQVGITTSDDNSQVATTTTTTGPTSSSSTATRQDMATSDSSQATSTSIPTCPPTSSSNHSELVALGAGLGAGLGVPLLISTALVIYCMGLRRRDQEQQGMMFEKPRNGAHHCGPKAELHGTTTSELVGSSRARSELAGS